MPARQPNVRAASLWRHAASSLFRLAAIEPWALDEEFQRRQRELAHRRQQMAVGLAVERERLARQLEAIQPCDQEVAAARGQLSETNTIPIPRRAAGVRRPTGSHGARWGVAWLGEAGW